jgi:hypothetical protein
MDGREGQEGGEGLNGDTFIDFPLFSWDKVSQWKPLSFNSIKGVFRNGQRNGEVVQ